MNMILHDNSAAEIWKDNSLLSPHWKEKDGRLKGFDYVVANPPFSTKAWSSGFDPEHDLYGRFENGLPPQKNGDFAFMLHVLKSMKSTGKGAIIMPHGVLFRGGYGYVAPPTYGIVYPPIYQAASHFYYPNLLATPHVGNNYYSSTSYVGAQITYQITVYNNGNVSLQIVANLTPPYKWDVNDTYSDCPDPLGAGSHCTLTWLLTPRVGGYAYIRVYVRGFYTDTVGNAGRVTGSPAFLFVVDP